MPDITRCEHKTHCKDFQKMKFETGAKKSGEKRIADIGVFFSLLFVKYIIIFIVFSHNFWKLFSRGGGGGAAGGGGGGGGV